MFAAEKNLNYKFDEINYLRNLQFEGIFRSSLSGIDFSFFVTLISNLKRENKYLKNNLKHRELYENQLTLPNAVAQSASACDPEFQHYFLLQNYQNS